MASGSADNGAFRTGSVAMGLFFLFTGGLDDSLGELESSLDRLRSWPPWLEPEGVIECRWESFDLSSEPSAVLRFSELEQEGVTKGRWESSDFVSPGPSAVLRYTGLF